MVVVGVLFDIMKLGSCSCSKHQSPLHGVLLEDTNSEVFGKYHTVQFNFQYTLNMAVIMYLTHIISISKSVNLLNNLILQISYLNIGEVTWIDPMSSNSTNANSSIQSLWVLPLLCTRKW